MTSRFTAATQANIVTGQVERYSCRTVAEVDTHLVRLRARLPYLNSPHVMRQHLEDIDLLLDQRTALATKVAS